MQISRHLLLIGLLLVYSVRTNSKKTPPKKETQNVEEDLDVAHQLPKTSEEESNLQKMADELNSPLDLDQPFVHDVFLSKLDSRHMSVPLR